MTALRDYRELNITPNQLLPVYKKLDYIDDRLDKLVDLLTRIEMRLNVLETPKSDFVDRLPLAD